MSRHLDESVLSELEELMEDEFDVLIRTYLTDAKDKIDLIAAHMEASDDLMLRESAHSLKGSSSNVGAHLLSDLCGHIETLAMDSQVSDAEAFLPGVRAEYREVCVALESRLAQ